MYHGKKIATHVRSYQKSAHTTLDEHMPKAHLPCQEWSVGRFLNWASEIGKFTLCLVRYLLENKPHPEQGYRSCLGPQEEDFHDLISERYERAATIVTSNVAFSEWGDTFTNKLLGAATLDRLKHGAYRLILEGDTSYRRSKDDTLNLKDRGKK